VKRLVQEDYSARKTDGSISGTNTGDQDLSDFATEHKQQVS
jgi:hypothetical protein